MAFSVCFYEINGVFFLQMVFYLINVVSEAIWKIKGCFAKRETR